MSKRIAAQREVTRRIPRPTPAMVVACVALAVAAAGTATAARTLTRGRDIATGAITTRNIAKGAVTAPKLAPGVLRGTGDAGGGLSGTYPNPSLAAGSVGSAQIQDGAVTAAKLGAGAIAQAPQVADGAIPLKGLRGQSWGASTDWGSVPQNGCRAVLLNEGPGSPIKAGDLLLPGVSPQLPDGIFAAPTVAPGDGKAAVLLCNATGIAIPVGNPTWVQFNYKIVR